MPSIGGESIVYWHWFGVKQPLVALLIGWSAGPKGPAFFFCRHGGWDIGRAPCAPLHSDYLAVSTKNPLAGRLRVPLLDKTTDSPVKWFT